MAKKRKSHNAAKATPPPAPSAPAPLAPAQWRSPVLSEAAYYGWISYIGYGLTGLLFILLTAYFIAGNLIRPRILDMQFVQRLMHPPENQPVEIYRIGPPDASVYAQSKEGKEGILFQFGPDAAAGFIVSINMLPIPDDARNLGLSIHSAYKGIPSINYGFTDRLPPPESATWYTFLSDNAAVVTEISPNEKEMRYFVTMAAHYYTPDQFKVGWREAKYFFFVFTAPTPTELFLDKLIFVEKQQ
ncbi:MAG: hypothetical protein JXR73_02895 [Candidatus Omnitrophica bacterium]|nr:hypothetical protein [Candidatus Omnitrophota bacterium]